MIQVQMIKNNFSYINSTFKKNFRFLVYVYLYDLKKIQTHSFKYFIKYIIVENNNLYVHMCNTLRKK